MTCFCSSCSQDFLEEKPIDFLNSDVVLTDREGFESAIVGLHESVRHLYFREDGAKMQAMYLGTDVAIAGDRSLPDFKDYTTWLTPTLFAVDHYWNWAYRNLLPRANTIIHYAENPEVVWESEEEKNAVIGEARFFRAYAYNFLANLYGGVPIVDQLYKAPKTDFERATRQEVYDFARQDLEFASDWIPSVATIEGRITKAAADHCQAQGVDIAKLALQFSIAHPSFTTCITGSSPRRISACAACATMCRRKKMARAPTKIATHRALSAPMRVEGSGGRRA